MRSNAFKSLAASAALLFLLVPQSFAQLHGAGGGKGTIREGLGRTWKGPSASVFGRILARRTKTREVPARGTSTRRPAAPAAAPSAATAPSTAAIKFRPGPDSGIAELLSTAFSTNAAEKAVLSELFRQLKQNYETEVASEGKSNDLAAAMTFFIASNVVAYHDSEVPSDAVTEDFYNSLRGVMASTPEIARLTNAEKQQIHDWLVYMGGFVLLGHLNAKNTNDASSLADYKAVADQSMRLVLGIGPADLTPDLQTSGSAAEPPASSGPYAESNAAIVGVWTAASSSPAGTSMASNVGLFRGRYTFNADGTYAFKSERWGGYMNSNTWWTTEESGTYNVSAGLLTVIPRTSRTTQRNSAGVVQKTQNNPPEKVTYRWTTHFFEGIQETNLVLEPPQKTARDGSLGGNSLFPKAYLYKRGDLLEWRY